MIFPMFPIRMQAQEPQELIQKDPSMISRIQSDHLARIFLSSRSIGLVLSTNNPSPSAIHALRFHRHRSIHLPYIQTSRGLRQLVHLLRGQLQHGLVRRHRLCQMIIGSHIPLLHLHQRLLSMNSVTCALRRTITRRFPRLLQRRHGTMKTSLH